MDNFTTNKRGFDYRPGGYRAWPTSPPARPTSSRVELLAFTGAGVSAASGIQTFASQPGVRDRLTRDYADENPVEFAKFVATWQSTCAAAEPNDAHLALAEHNVPIVTMNVDGLHARAGSTDLIEVHGRLPDVMLYGDETPLYQSALRRISDLEYRKFVLLVIGVSDATAFAEKFVRRARQRAFAVININTNAEVEVRQQVERLRAGVCRVDRGDGA